MTVEKIDTTNIIQQTQALAQKVKQNPELKTLLKKNSGSKSKHKIVSFLRYILTKDEIKFIKTTQSFSSFIDLLV